jgi:nucleoside-diphosphate-sugar epimerase
MKKNILITGGTGFVGANLIHRLVNEGHRPTVFIRKESNLWRLKNIASKITCVETDLLNSKLLSKQVKKIKPTHIFHLAVYGAQQGVQKDTIQTYTQNILSSVNLMEVCCKHGFQQYVNIGSSSEYGLKKTAMKEADMLQPINHYGATKAAISLAASVFSGTYKLPISTLRLFSPYGYWEDRRRFIPTLILDAINGKCAELSRPSYVRDFIFIDDVIDALIHFLTAKKHYNEVFNVGSGKQYTLQQVVDEVKLLSKNKLKVTWNNKKSNQMEPLFWKANISKTKKILKWKPTTSLKQGLQKTYEWILQNKNLYAIKQ